MTDAERRVAVAKLLHANFSVDTTIAFDDLSEHSHQRLLNIAFVIDQVSYPELHAEPPTHRLAPIEPAGQVEARVNLNFVQVAS